MTHDDDRRARLQALTNGGPATAPTYKLLDTAIAAQEGRVSARDLETAVRSVMHADALVADRILEELRPEIDAAVAALERKAPSSIRERLDLLTTRARRALDRLRSLFEDSAAGAKVGATWPVFLGEAVETVGVIQSPDRGPMNRSPELPPHFAPVLGSRTGMFLDRQTLFISFLDVKSTFSGELFVGARPAHQRRYVLVLADRRQQLTSHLPWPYDQLPSDLGLYMYSTGQQQ